MNLRTALVLTLAALSSASAVAACDDALKPLLGLRLEAVAGYESRLAAGIEREGRADVIPGVAFESLQGHSGEFVVDRVMAFQDDGRFYSIRAFINVPDQSDHGLALAVQSLVAVTGAAAHQDGIRTVFECPAGLELTIAPTSWDTGPRVLVQLTDPVAQARSRQHVASFCVAHAGQYACKR
jgi:hypothetical protein